MLIDAQLCVGPVFMKSGLEIRNIPKIHRINEHESASMTMTTQYVTGRSPQLRPLAKYIHKTVRTYTDRARCDWLLLMIKY